MNKIPLHSRVALKDGADQVYVFALAGTEGWVRAEKEDAEGFGMVRIEWDKEHWRYNGQPDGWTFAEHFKVIGPPEPVDTEAEDEDVEENLETDDVEMQRPPSKNDMDEYMESLSEAFEAAADGEGFVVFTVKRQPNPDNPSEVAFLPQMFHHTQTQEAEYLLDIHIAEASATNYQEMIFELLKKTRPNAIDE